MRLELSNNPWMFLLGLLVLASGTQAQALVPLPPQPRDLAFPTEQWLEATPGAGVEGPRLKAAIDTAFAAKGSTGVPDTRAVLVVQHGKIVAERYAPGFDATRRFESWSMAKTVTQALVAILVRQGRLDVRARAPIAAWQKPDDPRSKITLDNLLRMSSGLDNADDASAYLPDLLFGRGSLDVFSHAVQAELARPPGTHWAYSTATSMIVAGIVCATVRGGRDEMLAFMRKELFDPLGMRSAEPEFDAAGTFMGGSHVWANARDWARFGYLYLRDGLWDGTRILPQGWVDYSRTRDATADNSEYGVQLWLNVEPRHASESRTLPGAPSSVFALQGRGGQMVVVVPTRDLVVVRLGETLVSNEDAVHAYVAAIVAAFPAVAEEN